VAGYQASVPVIVLSATPVILGQVAVYTLRVFGQGYPVTIDQAGPRPVPEDQRCRASGLRML
jgi:hypothetical protein